MRRSLKSPASLVRFPPRRSVPFDTYIAVDWSAAASPKTGKDSIWIGATTRVSGRPRRLPEVNPATRAEAFAAIRERLVAARRGGLRVALGFDFSLAYPRGFASRLGCEGPLAWRQVWQRLAVEVRDAPDNANNRWEVAARLNREVSGGPSPFWGCPHGAAGSTLTPRRDDKNYAGIPRLRLTEEAMVEEGSRIQEDWKLYGAGSVGSQTLLGLPYLETLRRDPEVGPFIRVWPMETGFTLGALPERGPVFVLFEIWPGHVEGQVAAASDAEPGAVRDQLQVREYCSWLALLDEDILLSGLFEGPPDLLPDRREVCRREEGWVLGAGAAFGARGRGPA